MALSDLDVETLNRAKVVLDGVTKDLISRLSQAANPATWENGKDGAVPAVAILAGQLVDVTTARRLLD